MTTAYSTGTVSVGAGSMTVTGVATNWLTSGARAGDTIRIAGLTVRIAAVTSATSLTLAYGWPGPAQSGANYDIEFKFDDQRALTAASLLLQQMTGGTLTSLGQLAGGANKLPYFTGAGVMGQADLTAFARSLLDDTDQAAMQATLGLVPTASSLDATAGRLLKTGDFGLGGQIAGLLPPSNDASLAVATGWYDLDVSTAGRPAALNNGVMLVMRRGTNRTAQMAFSVQNNVEPRCWMRVQYGNGTTWSAWREMLHHSAILGTVLQSSGVPTGAVIERGSNANGEYVRFADGTQICTKTYSGLGPIQTAWGSSFVTASSISYGTMPAAFAGTPTPSLLCTGSPSAIVAGDTAMFFLMRPTSSAATTFSVAGTFTGRWF